MAEIPHSLQAMMLDLDEATLAIIAANTRAARVFNERITAGDVPKELIMSQRTVDEQRAQIAIICERLRACETRANET